MFLFEAVVKGISSRIGTREGSTWAVVTKSYQKGRYNITYMMSIVNRQTFMVAFEFAEGSGWCVPLFAAVAKGISSRIGTREGSTWAVVTKSYQKGRYDRTYMMSIVNRQIFMVEFEFAEGSGWCVPLCSRLARNIFTHRNARGVDLGCRD